MQIASMVGLTKLHLQNNTISVYFKTFVLLMSIDSLLPWETFSPSMRDLLSSVRVFFPPLVRVFILPTFSGTDSGFGWSRLPLFLFLFCFLLFSLSMLGSSLLFSFLLLLPPPILFPNLFSVFYPAGMPHSFSSLVRFSAMFPVEIVCRALVARLFPIPPLSRCYLPFSAVLFVGLHGLYLDSWLLCLCCWLSLLYGCARGADRNWMCIWWGVAWLWVSIGADQNSLRWRKQWNFIVVVCCVLPFGPTLFAWPFCFSVCVWPPLLVYKLFCVAFRCLIKSLLSKNKK